MPLNPAHSHLRQPDRITEDDLLTPPLNQSIAIALDTPQPSEAKRENPPFGRQLTGLGTSKNRGDGSSRKRKFLETREFKNSLLTIYLALGGAPP